MPRGGHRTPDVQTHRNDDFFSGEIACDQQFFERNAREAGYTRIAGLDEAGRGPLAGPVVAAAVVLPDGLLIPGVTDSKQVSEKNRDRLFDIIREHAICYGIGVADERTIDDVNIYQATIVAMERSLEALHPQPDYLLLDAMILPGVPIPQKSLIKGDCRSHSIAAASILAKVIRDRMMLELHDQYPQYNFRKHKGYGTREHLEALHKHGPCDAHRKTFKPVAWMLDRNRQ